jgi:hypothetical protein
MKKAVAGDVHPWRVQRLAAAGFSARDALILAADDRVDLHMLLDLIDRGCPPALAARITAPLEDAPVR